MSTGLTWVSVWDYNTANTFTGSVGYTFNDYNEAVDFCLYTGRSIAVNIIDPANIYFVIYTTSPNANGYVVAATIPVFVPFD